MRKNLLKCILLIQTKMLTKIHSHLMLLKGAEVFAFIRSAIPFAKSCTGFVAKTLLRPRAGDSKWLRRTIEAFMAKKRVQLCEDFENHQVIYLCKVYLCEMELITRQSFKLGCDQLPDVGGEIVQSADHIEPLLLVQI